MNDYGNVFKVVREALESAMDAFEECQDYPITSKQVSEALDVVYDVIERDSKIWKITIPSAKDIVDSVNRG